jgi:hypothetical protein
VKQAEATLGTPEARISPLLSAAHGTHAWLDRFGARPPIRAALVRYWKSHGLFRSPIPLTGAGALRAETSWKAETWIPLFLNALAEEADDGRELLLNMERAWLAARRAVAGRRRNSRAAAAVDMLAAAPLISAMSLAGALGMAPKSAIEILAGFCADGIAVEVTHRSSRRLFGLVGLAPLRDEVSPPRRSEPGRGRGRPPSIKVDIEQPPPPTPPPDPRMKPFERRAIDYSELEQALGHLEHVIRDTRRALDILGRVQGTVPAVARFQDPVVSGDTEISGGCLGPALMNEDE